MTKCITSIALLLLSLSAFAASDYVCKHNTGDDVYYGHNIVLVEVASKEITVSAYSDMRKVKNISGYIRLLLTMTLVSELK